MLHVCFSAHLPQISAKLTSGLHVYYNFHLHRKDLFFQSLVLDFFLSKLFNSIKEKVSVHMCVVYYSPGDLLEFPWELNLSFLSICQAEVEASRISHIFFSSFYLFFFPFFLVYIKYISLLPRLSTIQGLLVLEGQV